MKAAMGPVHGALLPAATTLSAIALTSLFPIVGAFEKTYTSLCDVDLVGTPKRLTETECIFLDSTFLHTYNSYITDPHALEGTKELLDVIVISQEGDEPIDKTRTGRRKLHRTTKKMDALASCTKGVCDDPDAELLEDGLSRRLRTDRRLGSLNSFKNEFCRALKNSEFDAFRTLTSCEVSCGELTPMTIEQWFATWYTNLEINEQQVLDAEASPTEEVTTLAAAPPPDDTATTAAVALTDEEKGAKTPKGEETTLAAVLPPDDTEVDKEKDGGKERGEKQRRAAAELTYRFEGLDDYACRFSQDPELGGSTDPLAKGTDNKYFREVNRITEEECQDYCEADDGCCGYEYYSSWSRSGQCALWKATAGIGWMKQQEGFKCVRKVANEPPPAPATTSRVTAAVKPARYYYRGEANHACRYDPVHPTKGGPHDPELSGANNKYYVIAEGHATLQACEDECTSRSDCIGVEWHELWKRCELWNDSTELGIGWMTPADGFQCYRKTATKDDPVFQFLAVWPDETGDNENYTKEFRSLYGDHWCESASSGVHATELDGFAWGKTCGGLRYTEMGYASYIAGTPVDNLDDLSDQQKAKVQAFTADVSNSFSKSRKWKR